MNKAQLQSLQHLTRRIHQHNLMESVDSTMNGNMVFELLDWGVDRDGDKLVVLSASNTGTTKWFETSYHVLAVIGKRGGVEIRLCNGMKRSLLK